MSQRIIETTNRIVEDAYANVRAGFQVSGKSDIVSYWLSIRDQYHYLGESEFDSLNRKIISENAQKINS